MSTSLCMSYVHWCFGCLHVARLGVVQKEQSAWLTVCVWACQASYSLAPINLDLIDSITTVLTIVVEWLNPMSLVPCSLLVLVQSHSELDLA
jgi:hypothetical protein